MASNLSVLSQYVTSLHQISTEVLQLVFGQELFPSHAIDDAAPVLRVHRVATQMAAMGLWSPPIGTHGTLLPNYWNTQLDSNCYHISWATVLGSGIFFYYVLYVMLPGLVYASPLILFGLTV